MWGSGSPRKAEEARQPLRSGGASEVLSKLIMRSSSKAKCRRHGIPLVKPVAGLILFHDPSETAEERRATGFVASRVQEEARTWSSTRTACSHRSPSVTR